MAALRFGCALLASLFAAAAALAAPFAYIPHDDGVAVIDVGSQTIVTNIRTPGPLRDIATQPDSTRAYVMADPIRVIDIRSQVVTLQLDIDGAYYMALSPREPKAVLLTDTGIRIIDIDSRGTLATLNPGGTLRRVAFDAAGRRAFVSDAASGRVHIIDMSSYQLVGTIALGATPTDMQVHPTLNRLYVALTSSNAVRLINLDNNATIANINVNVAPSDIVANEAGSLLYVTNSGSNNVSVIDTEPNIAVATIPVGPSPEGIDITPDGAFVYVVNRGGGSVSVISTATATVVNGITVGVNLQARGQFIGGPSGPAPSAIGPYSGLWWNPSEPGWGVHLTQRRNRIFAAWFTYGPQGNAHWYVVDDCAIQPDPACPTCERRAICTGNIIETRGPDIQQEPFRPGDVTRGGVGTFELKFADYDNAALTYTLYGEPAKGAAIRRQVFAAGEPSGTNYTDLWWNPNESGWGMGITQQDGIMFLTWFVYDANRLPGWYIASRCEVIAGGNGCNGRLYRTSGPPGPRNAANGFDSSRLQVEDVGVIEVRFHDNDTGTINYILRGVAQSKTITRQFF